MSVIRVKHNKENPYVQLNKKALWDEKISLKAIGLWARCISRPDDWTFNIVEIIKNCKEGKTAIYGAINELINCGYALRIQIKEKDDLGRYTFQKVEYIFFEFKLDEKEKQEFLEEFKKSFPLSGFLDAENPDPENEPLLKKEEELKKEENQPTNPPTPQPPPERSVGGSASEEFLKKIVFKSEKFPPEGKKLPLDVVNELKKFPLDRLKAAFYYQMRRMEDGLEPDSFSGYYIWCVTKKVSNHYVENVKTFISMESKIDIKSWDYKADYIVDPLGKDLTFELPPQTFATTLQSWVEANNGRH